MRLAHARRQHDSVGESGGILLVLLALAALVSAGCSTTTSGPAGTSSLRKGLAFVASFDRSSDADFSRGDPWLYQAPAMDKWKEARPGLPTNGSVHVVATGGRHGGCLRFERAHEGAVFYRGQSNVVWKPGNWSGTVSCWLRAGFAELRDGYCDPLNITPRAWNDAAFFVEFEKRPRGVPFRLGAYADFKVWNPLNRKFEDIPAAERPLVTIEGPPFGADRWTHVVFTWEKFNTGRSDGVATLYLDGAAVGSIRNRTQTFTWNPADVRLLVGASYVGWLDDLAVFDRALTADEVQRLRQLPGGVRSLLKP